MRHLSSEDPKLSRTEEAALNNIITVAKERIWLDDPLNAQEYNSDNFDESLGLDSVENIKRSISVAESYICKYKTHTDEWKYLNCYEKPKFISF